MKYEAYKKNEAERLINGLKSQIEEIQDSNEEEDIAKLCILKECLQDFIDHHNKEAQMKILVKHHLEGEKLTKFFLLNKENSTVLHTGEGSDK